MKNKTSKIYYRLSRENRGEYSHIHIDIIESAYTWNQFGPCGVDLSLEWQSHKGSNQWYGAGVTIKTKSISGIKRCHQFISKLCGDSIGTPEEVIVALEAKKIKRGVYDQRISDFLPIENVPPIDHVRWGAVNERGGWTISVVAPRDEEEASRLLAKALSDYSLDAYEKWILAGKPVKVDSHSTPPAISEIDLKPL
jgi:hypothetical protein